MSRPSEPGKPTAMKIRGCEFYLPAVTTAFGPKQLPSGERRDTRSKAVTEARRVMREAEKGGAK